MLSMSSMHSWIHDKPQDQMSLLNDMNAGCEDITGEQRTAAPCKDNFPLVHCKAKQNIRCDDENIWPDWQDVHKNEN